MYLVYIVINTISFHTCIQSNLSNLATTMRGQTVQSNHSNLATAMRGQPVQSNQYNLAIAIRCQPVQSNLSYQASDESLTCTINHVLSGHCNEWSTSFSQTIPMYVIYMIYTIAMYMMHIPVVYI